MAVSLPAVWTVSTSTGLLNYPQVTGCFLTWVGCAGQLNPTKRNADCAPLPACRVLQKPLTESGIEPGSSCTQSGCVTTAPPSQLKVKIVVRLFNCFDAMGRNVNKQTRLCGPDIFNKYMFSVIFLHAWITIFGSFSYWLE